MPVINLLMCTDNDQEEMNILITPKHHDKIKEWQKL